MTEQIKPYVGEDGRLYFKYAVGEEFTFTPTAGKKFSQRIAECEYDDGKEYYYLESAGKILPTRFSVEEFELLLSQMPCEITDEGERRELPLLVAEVESYYGEMAKEKNNANAEANKKLKGTDYFKLLTAQGSLRKCLMRAEADERESDAKQLRDKLNENETARMKLIADNDIDIKILTRVPDCSLCNDKGVVDGAICECAIARAASIKAYNAALRRAENRGSQWSK